MNVAPPRSPGSVDMSDRQVPRQTVPTHDVIRLSRKALSLTFGLLSAGAIFLATNLLVIKGGPTVGAHLELLNQYFPGYRVTFPGSLIGAGYSFLVGAGSGWMIAVVYNAVVSYRRR
jgi:hypothetical protein